MKLLSRRVSGVLLASLIGASIAAATALHYSRGRSDAQDPAAFAETSVRAITGSWNPDEMMKRAAPEILTPFVRQELPNSYARLDAKLGKLKTLSAPVSDNAPPLPGQDPMANPAPVTVPEAYDGMVQRYLFNAQFATGGPALVEIVMRYHEKWQIVGLHIDSGLLPN